MHHVTLAGQFPAHTLEKLRAALPADRYTVRLIDDQAQYDRMTDAEIIVLRIFKAQADVIERNPNLRIILRAGAGFDKVDIAAAGARGIYVTNTPGANAYSVAELAVMLMLAVGRRLYCHVRCMDRGEWSKDTFLEESSCLKGKRVGILGVGHIGRYVARLVRAFGATVQYYDAFRLPHEQEEEYGLPYVPLDELFRTSQIVSVHVPMLEETRNLVNRERIARMPDGAMIINTARGGVVDEAAVLEAIRSGKLSGAGFDATVEEPLPADSPLLAEPRVVVTPHIGAAVGDIADAFIPMLAESLFDYAAGKTPRYLVNGQYLK